MCDGAKVTPSHMYVNGLRDFSCAPGRLSHMGDGGRQRKTPLSPADLLISEALRKAIATLNWTWKDWQRATGMSRQNLWRVAQGEVAMTTGRAARLAAALGTTLSGLLGETACPEDPRVALLEAENARLKQRLARVHEETDPSEVCPPRDQFGRGAPSRGEPGQAVRGKR